MQPTTATNTHHTPHRTRRCRNATGKQPPSLFALNTASWQVHPLQGLAGVGEWQRVTHNSTSVTRR
jgi:hypothetical protein